MKEADVKNVHWKRLGRYVLLFFLIIDSYMFVRLTGLEHKPQIIQLCMMTVGVLTIVCAGVCKKKGTLTEQNKVLLILLYGLVMRIGYMMYTGCDVRSHDVGDITVNGYGHAAYLLKLIENGSLPESNQIQLYQQPFFYLAGSLVSRMVNGLLRENSEYYLVDAAKIVSCFASCMTLLLAERVCKQLALKEKGHVAAMGLIAFLPDLWLTGGRVNCDACNTFFFLLAFYYTYQWYQKPSWKNILSLAFTYGFGMMNKVSLGVMAAFTASVFLWMLWKAEEKDKLVSLLKKYLVFACISLPLGLWYAVRNAMLFGQSLTYVLDLKSVPQIYCGNYSLVQRFVTWDIKNLFSTPYADPWSDYNVPVYAIKTALFGEFTYEICDWIPALLLFSAVVLAVCVMAALYRVIRQGKTNQGMLWVVSVFGICSASYLYFCWKYPYGCSMDFRYVVILGVFAAFLLGSDIDREKNEKRQHALSMVCAVFCVLSCLMYLLMK